MSDIAKSPKSQKLEGQSSNGSKSSPSDSYVLPYTMIGGVCGVALTYLTESPVFLLGVPLGSAAGMIRDKNIRTKSNGVMSSVMKVTGIYVLGVPVLIAGGLFIVAVWVKTLK